MRDPKRMDRTDVADNVDTLSTENVDIRDSDEAGSEDIAEHAGEYRKPLVAEKKVWEAQTLSRWFLTFLLCSDSENDSDYNPEEE